MRMLTAIAVAVVAAMLLLPTAATADAEMACPVPGATFVDSFGAPRDGHSHQGVDMMAPFDTPVLAPESGVYEQHGSESFYLLGDSGTLYFGTHLGGHLAADGPVTAGQPIALVSNTGNASGGDPHLHFEIHPGGGEAVDPYPATLEACTRPVANGMELVRTETAIPPMTFIFGPGETQRWYNAQHPQPERISRPEARVLAHYLNGLIWPRVIAYVRAMTPTSCSGPSSCEALVRSLARRWGVGEQGAVNVMYCESGGNPNASNGGNYLGLFQHSATYWPGRANTYGHPGASAFNGYANADVTMQMVRAGGWGPWECQP